MSEPLALASPPPKMVPSSVIGAFAVFSLTALLATLTIASPFTTDVLAPP